MTMNRIHELLLGRIDAGSFAFYRAWENPGLSELIGAGAAAAVLLGALVVIIWITRRGLWNTLWRNWLTTVDAKRIGIMYIVLAFVMLARGLIEGALMRAQQAVAIDKPGMLAAEHFGELFTTHGTIMIFFVGMPFLTGLINFVIPLQIGARDVAFPRLNALSLWLTVASAMLVMISLVIGQYSSGGWTGYPPFTGIHYSPGVGVDYWIWSLAPASIATTLSGLNFMVTIYKYRAPGLTLMRMPLFSWTALCTSILMVFALPPLTVTTLLLALDRYLGFHFFTNDLGGNMMHYPNLFWIFGHPEVYILILPAFGVFSSVFPVFSAKRLYGYTSLVYATMAIAVLSFTVWLHHFFTMGQSANINAVFGIATMAIGIPTGVKVYDWLATLYRGRIRFSSPLIWSLGFVFLFVIGGLTGILLAAPPVDFQVHNTVFLVAHFHNMLIPGMLFGMFAGYMYWFPKAFGFRLHEGLGRIAALCFIIGFCLTFFPLYVTGLEGMTRRTVIIYQEHWRPWLILAGIGPVFLLAGFAAILAQLWISVRHRDQLAVPAGDPWHARSLEWSVAAPPPEYNFAVLPQVEGRDAFMAMKQTGTAYRAAEVYEDIYLPANTAWPFVVSLLTGLLCFALIFHIWWLALSGLVALLISSIVATFGPEVERMIPAQTVEAEHRHWLEIVAKTHAVGRGKEFTTKNRGRAELSS